MSRRRLTTPAHVDQLESISRFIEECANSAKFNDRDNYACQLAVSEVCENVIKHGYGEENEGTIDLNVLADVGEMTVEIFDTAPAFNPTLLSESPTNNTNDDPPVGGLGLRIIYRVMDTVEYSRRGEQNCLRLVKHTTPG